MIERKLLSVPPPVPIVGRCGEPQQEAVHRTSRRTFLGASLAGAVCGMTRLAGEIQASGVGRRLNVLFIMVDDLRPELGCYGHPTVKTPNIDRLAARGTVFTNNYCQVALCSPSRTSLLTGLRPDSSRVWSIGPHFRDSVPNVRTLPEHFRENGYFTQAFGKVFHNKSLDDAASWSAPLFVPAAQPYGPEEMPRVAAERKRLEEMKAAGKRIDPVTGMPLFLIRPGPSWEAPDVPDNYFWDGKVADEVISVLKTRPDQPFFLCAGFIKPHLPFVAPKKYFDQYAPEDVVLPDFTERPKDAPDIEFLVNEWIRYRDIRETGRVSDKKAAELIRAYYAATSYVDAQVGRLLDALDRLSLTDSTVVVLWGDNGYKLGEYGYWGKESNFELDTHVPVIISVPGQEHQGSACTALTETIDLYPTLCDLCGLTVPRHVEADSMAPLIGTEKSTWKTAAFSQFYRYNGYMGYTMRTEQYRYTEWMRFNPKPPPSLEDLPHAVSRELYDHRVDPEEHVNVASAPENAGLVNDLSRRLRAGWRAARPHTEL